MSKNLINHQNIESKFFREAYYWSLGGFKLSSPKLREIRDVPLKVTFTFSLKILTCNKLKT